MNYSVKLKVNLKVSSLEIIPRGQVYTGPVDELPTFIQNIIADDDRTVAEIKVKAKEPEIVVTSDDDAPDAALDDSATNGTVSEVPIDGSVVEKETPKKVSKPAVTRRVNKRTKK